LGCVQGVRLAGLATLGGTLGVASLLVAVSVGKRLLVPPDIVDWLGASVAVVLGKPIILFFIGYYVIVKLS
jgi:hypothetical protein